MLQNKLLIFVACCTLAFKAQTEQGNPTQKASKKVLKQSNGKKTPNIN